MGQATGYIKGRSATPFFFTLPHSKLIFELVPSFDLTAVKVPEDHYDSSPEIPVMLRLEDYITEMTDESEHYSERFLFNSDPTFQKILKLP